ncbi:Na+/H+ antiporter subunit E [Parvularcula sp. ZS-1/3]|uniref:Na+/H+ antiporter subunit E n=1 Tax=Parvularcula mediterranea TaxID=2732508 RepID=A0A7Y3W5R8_9PROT|nr:Na+/H+ antiporter subunit E [Parvularcula mediterranea]NNU16612.1 Na+/H+ antiporter subunit E [Parvularcula mediterranea]
MSEFLKISGRRIVLVLALIALWMLLSGYWNKATLVAFGAFSVAVTLWFSERAEIVDREGVPTSIFPRILTYMSWLLLEIGKANIIVAREVIRPQIKLAPKMIRVPADQPSDLTRTIFANSVTLTPGTVTVDVREDCLLIHALDEKLADVEGIAEMGAKCTRLESGRGA